MQSAIRILALVAALHVLVGCATSDYHQTSYYRHTFDQLRSPTAVASSSESSPLRAAASKVEITPPTGTPLQGYGARRGEPSRGVHDPLYARVLVLQNLRTRLVLVSCDLMAVTDNLYNAVWQKVKHRVPLTKRELLIFATHTHSGAGGLSNRFAMELVGGRFRPRLFEATTDKIAAAIVEAVGDARPARISIGSRPGSDLNQNRMRADSPVDREIKFMRVTRLDGKPIAWLVNFAAHPTAMGINWEFSADFPGYLAGELERDGAVCLFANGAAGDLNLQKRNHESHEARAERVGQSLAATVLEAATSTRDKDRVAMDSRRLVVEMPPVRIRVGRNPNCALPSWLGNCLFPREVPLLLARVDQTLLLAAPVEFNAVVGLELKRVAATLGYDLFILGYANDYIGYVVPERDYATAAYEARTSFYGPKLDGYLKEVIVRMMEDMPP